MDEDRVKVVKIGKKALFEFLYEKFIEEQEDYLDVSSLDAADAFDIDWENGRFIFCAYRSEDSAGKPIRFPEGIDLQQLLRKIPDTTDSMFTHGRYREYTKEELIQLSKQACATDRLQVLNDNYRAENGSFLYYLHEENHFDEEALSKLCECVDFLYTAGPQSSAVSKRLSFIYSQVLKHIIYHFDPNDQSRISDLPHDYNEKLEILECAVMRYFCGSPGQLESGR